MATGPAFAYPMVGAMNLIPDYLAVPAHELGHGQPVRVRILGDMAAVADDVARAMADVIRDARAQGHGATLIVPVGPVDQFPLLAGLVNAERLSLRDAVVI